MDQYDLKFSKILEITKEDSNFPLKYLNNLFNYYNEKNVSYPLKCINPLAAIKCFIPLPTKLLLSELYSDKNKIIKKLNNVYEFHGDPGNRLVISDKKLPWSNNEKIPIPFSFPICNDDNVEVVLSNVYYYEITIGNKVKNYSWESECVSIGFGSKNTKFETHVGWCDDSIGFHSDDGTIRMNCGNNTSTSYSESWKEGDVAGAGLIFIGDKEVKPFFTFNGKLIKLFDKSIVLKDSYFPIIGYDHSNSIKLNFSTDKFKFNIKRLINEHSKIIISTQNSFIDNYDQSAYINEGPNIQKLPTPQLFGSLPSFHLTNFLPSGPIMELLSTIQEGGLVLQTPTPTMDIISGTLLDNPQFFYDYIGITSDNTSPIINQSNMNNITGTSIINLPNTNNTMESTN